MSAWEYARLHESMTGSEDGRLLSLTSTFFTGEFGPEQLDVGTTSDPTSIVSRLNELGDRGWEVINWRVVDLDATDRSTISRDTTYLLKRPRD